MGSFKVLYDYPNFASLPAVGEVSKLYITNDNNTLYRWVDGAYHFFTTTSVPWGNIDGVLTNQTDLMAILNTKQGLITAGTTAQYYRGDKTFQTLNTAVVPESGNLYYSQARFDSAFGAKSTTDLAEGSKLFYTQGRFDSAFAAKSTSNLTEGSNLYYTDARFDTRLATKSTSNLAEGSNLYYTQGRFDSAFSAKKTDNLSEGITNFYYTSNRFNADFNSKNTDSLPEGISNVYFTAARSRNALTLTTVGSGGAATYNSTTGVLNIPMYEDNLVDPLTGAGSAGYLGKYTGSTSIAPSLIYDNGVYVGINRTNPFYTLDVNGTLNVQGVSIYRNLAGTGSRLVYVDSTGTLTPAIIGSGLSMVSGTLSATGTASGSIGGSGTIDYIPKFSGTAAITNSNIQDSGSLITLGSNSYINGTLGIGITPQANYGLRLAKTITSNADSVGISSEGQIQSDVTSTANLFNSALNTQATTFTLANFRHYRAVQGTIGAGSTVTTQIGFLAESNLTGATNNYGFYGNIPSGTGRWNLYMNGTANNYLAGSLLIGSTSQISGVTKLEVTGGTYITGGLSIGTSYSTVSNISSNKNITGATISYGILQSGTVQSDVTSNTYGYFNQSNTQASAFTLGEYTHYFASQGTIGSTSAITTQQGFVVNSNLTGATNNYGFRGVIPNGTNRWNLYMDGTANNYLAGSLGIGNTSLTGYNLLVAKNITGSSVSYNIYSGGNIQSDVTSIGSYYFSSAGTQATTFSLSQLIHYNTYQNTFGSGSSVNAQVGFQASNTLIGATFNYGFRGLIPSGTGRWNLYMDGTAQNYLAGALSIGVTSANASALLQVDSTTQGVLFPRMTTTQKNAISSPAVGLIVYDTTLNKLCVYTGAWQTITSA